MTSRREGIGGVRVVPFGAGSNFARVDQEVEAIFFATAARKELASVGEREQFRHCWLDRYVYRYLCECLVARADDGSAVGYLVGANEDVASVPAFGEIAYFRVFAKECAAYPAHLHVNVKPGWQGRGIGRRLVEAFCAHVKRQGVPAVHVVTAADAANLGFYERTGFAPVRRRRVEGRALMLLGRRL